jgi:hypothetical protein
MRGVAADYGRWLSVPGPGDAPFSTERLARGFWIGEVDGTCVFLDAETLGVFAYTEYCDTQHVEWWAPSFAAFVAHGQQGRAEPLYGLKSQEGAARTGQNFPSKNNSCEA